MTSVNLSTLFEEFQHTAFRLETRQDYDVSAETESFRAFQEGLPRPERSVRTNAYLQAVSRATLVGKQWSRVRLVEFPLSLYTRYELVSYAESQAAGEQVMLLDHSETLYPGTDFWLFDRGHTTAQAVFMNYTDAGEFIGLESVTDLALLRDLASIATNLLARATPLNLFLAAQAGV